MDLMCLALRTLFGVREGGGAGKPASVSRRDWMRQPECSRKAVDPFSTLERNHKFEIAQTN